MKRIYRFLGIALCSAMVLSLPAAAASGGQASGKSTLKLIGDRTIRGAVTISAAGPLDVFYSDSGRSNAAEELAERDAAAQKVYMETGIELESLSFVSFEYLWLKNEDELDPQYKPLKTFLIDEFILAGEGEGLPSGVYYDDHNAYIVRSLGDGKMRLVHSRIGDAAAQAAEDTMTVNAQDSERLFDGRTYSLAGTYDIE